jgi:predicted RNase H-like HicB family nuclease
MSHIYFPAIIERGPENYSVYFPDLPGCVSAGDTIDETARNAEEALSLHLLGMIEDGEVIPQPSSLDDTLVPDFTDPNPAPWQPAARLLVRVEVPGRKIRINVNLDEGLIAAIDAVSSNRSGFIAAATRAALSARS